MTAEERHLPSSFERIDTAVALVLGHVERGSRIIVHGDYDCDGVASTAILVRVLRVLGADVNWFLPEPRRRRLRPEHLRPWSGSPRWAPGCSSPPTARSPPSTRSPRARSSVSTCVVTDHHEPRADGVLPDAPIVHPRVCGYPCADLCAAGVAYKLAAALLAGAGHDPADADVDLDVVALATIADCVPLRRREPPARARGSRCAVAHAPRGSAGADATSPRSIRPLIDEQTVGLPARPADQRRRAACSAPTPEWSCCSRSIRREPRGSRASWTR